MIDDIVILPSKCRGAATVVPTFFHTWLALFRARPDRLYILHQSFRYRLAARLAGIREVIAYPPDLACSKDDGWRKSLSFLRQRGLAVAEPYSNLAVDPANVEAMRQHFAQYPQPWIIVAPGASTPARRWPVDRFAFCTEALAKDTGGTVFLIGCKKESECIATIQRLCTSNEKIVSVIGLDFDKIMGLIACSTCLLGNDSGPANVAAAMGKPAFPLCGTSTPPLHSLNLHLIMPDLPPESGEGMELISAQHALNVVMKELHRD
jgi:ADP-heptose:LPS heptosyltransferase